MRTTGTMRKRIDTTDVDLVGGKIERREGESFQAEVLLQGEKPKKKRKPRKISSPLPKDKNAVQSPVEKATAALGMKMQIKEQKDLKSARAMKGVSLLDQFMKYEDYRVVAFDNADYPEYIKQQQALEKKRARE